MNKQDEGNIRAKKTKILHVIIMIYKLNNLRKDKFNFLSHYEWCSLQQRKRHYLDLYINFLQVFVESYDAMTDPFHFEEMRRWRRRMCSPDKGFS